MGSGYISEKRPHLNRLRRIEGQVRGLQRLVNEEAYCIDVVTQISAVTRALETAALSLLDEHLRHCVAEAVRERNVAEAVQERNEVAEAKLAEASAAIARLVRS